MPGQWNSLKSLYIQGPPLYPYLNTTVPTVMRTSLKGPLVYTNSPLLSRFGFGHILSM